MPISAEATSARSGRNLLDAGVDEVLMPCIGSFDEALDAAAAVGGP